MAEPAVHASGVDIVPSGKLFDSSQSLVRFRVNNLGFEVRETYETVDGIIDLSYQF